METKFCDLTCDLQEDAEVRNDTACVNHPKVLSDCYKQSEESDSRDTPHEISLNELGKAICDDHVTSPEDRLEGELLNFLAGTNALFKSQQIGDPELTFAQKRSIAAELLRKSPSQFLSRFGTKIKPEHLKYFVPMRDDYEVDFYFRKLQRLHSKELNVVDIKNRRYEALQKLISESSYFSEEEMKSRNPLLYEQLIGQHLTSAERAEKARDYSKMTYVGYLLDRMDRDSMNDLMQKQKDEEDACLEEEETDDESGDEDDVKLNDKEKDVLRQEFISSMYRSFIEGKDKDFDYSSVDFNAEYDCHQDMDRDDEEKYFDSETPDSLMMESSHLIENNEEDELDAYMNKLNQ
ncbi:hypothetical protein J437_LFUL014416 [Ladona fulva]|uniref:CCD97-like C-terminal domain-containing protein n=1 Tax=Ladona fulva TaxID=123851 RepID=A0A8K0K4H0_LADFU|nr:hypothetical protein J437_LFUL014416 [Ladona fulva]